MPHGQAQPAFHFKEITLVISNPCGILRRRRFFLLISLSQMRNHVENDADERHEELQQHKHDQIEVAFFVGKTTNREHCNERAAMRHRVDTNRRNRDDSVQCVE